MGLTKAQVASIQNNWALVAQNLQEFGNVLFIRYLTAHPNDLALFDKFSNANLDDLRADPAFQAQTLTVVSFLSKVVANLTNIDAASTLLRQRVHTHAPMGITMAQFERLLDLLPRLLQEFGCASGSTADAWRVAVAALMPAMRDEFTKV